MAKWTKEPAETMEDDKKLPDRRFFFLDFNKIEKTENVSKNADTNGGENDDFLHFFFCKKLFSCGRIPMVILKIVKKKDSRTVNRFDFFDVGPSEKRFWSIKNDVF